MSCRQWGREQRRHSLHTTRLLLWRGRRQRLATSLLRRRQRPQMLQAAPCSEPRRGAGRGHRSRRVQRV